VKERQQFSASMTERACASLPNGGDFQELNSNSTTSGIKLQRKQEDPMTSRSESEYEVIKHNLTSIHIWSRLKRNSVRLSYYSTAMILDFQLKGQNLQIQNTCQPQSLQIMGGPLHPLRKQCDFVATERLEAFARTSSTVTRFCTQ
jgi:hypothetical protein